MSLDCHAARVNVTTQSRSIDNNNLYLLETTESLDNKNKFKRI